MRVLDLFCGGGGASMGIHQALEEAGIVHEIFGVDINEMPEYPFNFIRSDVFELDIEWIKGFNYIWTSPPCQAYVDCNFRKETNHPRYIKPIRKMLRGINKPFVIENVQKAPLRKDLMLCGTMFNIGVFRHRYFEIYGFYVPQLKHKKHKGYIGDGKYYMIISGGYTSRYRKGGSRFESIKDLGDFESWSSAMGISWLEKPNSRFLPNNHPLCEAIPPVYSKYITESFIESIEKPVKDYYKKKKPKTIFTI